MKIHRVKCVGHWFEQCVTGEKPFEVRKNDRNYEVGDLIELNETRNAEYTGRAALYRITFVLTSEDFPDGIKGGYAVLGIEPVTGAYDDYGRFI